jgi:hypothetical protein
MYEAESINADCVSVSWQAFFKCGIKIGFRFKANPHKKNREVTRMIANFVFVFDFGWLIVSLFG